MCVGDIVTWCWTRPRRRRLDLRYTGSCFQHKLNLRLGEDYLHGKYATDPRVTSIVQQASRHHLWHYIHPSLCWNWSETSFVCY